MAILCNKMGIDLWEVIEAAKTKPYGFMAFYPGPGLGGHCIPIDPFYLTWKAREYNYHTRLIEVAGEINNEMPNFVVDRTMKILNRYQKSLSGAKVLVLGVAYKKDIDDYRESPVMEIIQLLESYQSDFELVDPHIPSFHLNGKVYETVTITEEKLKEADLVLITTDHSAFDYQQIADSAKAIFDTRNAMKEIQNSKAYYEKL